MAQTPGVLLARAPAWAIALALAALAFAVRAPTFGNPFLGFDEQFYLLVGDRMLHGALPYVDIFDRKPIGLLLLYAGVRALGGEGVLQYQLAAATCAAATAILLNRFALRLAAPLGAAAAAAAYILWLNLAEGEGGQAPVFFNLPMLVAAMLTARAWASPTRSAHPGLAAMLVVGIAMQIKYTALFEGIFLGCALLWSAQRAGGRAPRLAALAALWIVAALAPTLLALGTYAALGHAPAFIFANFASLAGRLPDPVPARLLGLAVLAAILAPLVACAYLARPRTPEAAFARAWLLAALASILAFGAWLSPHYALPVLAPAALAAAPRLGTRPRLALVLLATSLIAGQIVLHLTERAKGGRAQALALTAAVTPHHGCLYVYDGPPSLYLLTHSPLPTRWPFPGHLNTRDEASPAAIGTNATAEVRRIMAAHPEVVVDTAPAYALGNPETRAIVEASLARDYHLTFTQRTGTRTRLVYRLNGNIRSAGCTLPSAA